MPVKVTGQSGELRIGGYTAARLGAWECESEGARDAFSFTLRADVEETDEYWMDHGGPYELRLHQSSERSLRWRGVEPWLDDDDGAEILRWEGATKPDTI